MTAEQKRERKTPEERQRWMDMMTAIEALMCNFCGSVPCLCHGESLYYTYSKKGEKNVTNDTSTTTAIRNP